MAISIKINTRSIDGLKNKLLNPQAIDTAVRTAATTALAEIKTRVFERGEATDGDIGVYSRKPMYVSLSESPRKFVPRGKNSDSPKLKNGKPRRSGYFQGGYDEFKTTVGRNIGKVNLSLSGQLNNQMTIIATSKGYGLGWNNTEMAKRAQYFPIKYKKQIWLPTKDELELIKSVAAKTYVDALSE